MSERQEKKKRYNLRLMWIADFDKCPFEDFCKVKFTNPPVDWMKEEAVSDG